MDTLFSTLAEGFDLPILQWLQANLGCPFLDAVMVPVTHLADGGALWIAMALILLLFPKYRKAGLTMGAALLMGLVVCNLTMKPLFARIRPFEYELLHFGRNVELLIAAPADYSFPSGHTLASFEAATALFLCHKKAGIAALVLAALIAFSRLYLYVHYPTDVLFSVVMGVLFGFLAFRILSKRKKSPSDSSKL